MADLNSFNNTEYDMTIPLIKEPEDVWMANLSEKCIFCHTPTRYWHENTNNPLCHKCAKSHKVSELPDHGQQIRAAKRRTQRKEVQNAR